MATQSSWMWILSPLVWWTFSATQSGRRVPESASSTLAELGLNGKVEPMQPDPLLPVGFSASPQIYTEAAQKAAELNYKAGGNALYVYGDNTIEARLAESGKPILLVVMRK